jgi:hypothetical protein
MEVMTPLGSDETQELATPAGSSARRQGGRVTRLDAFLAEQPSLLDATGRRGLEREPSAARRQRSATPPAKASGESIDGTPAVRLALSVEQAAEALAIGRTTAWRKIRAGEIPARVIPNTDRVIVPIADLGAYLDSLPRYGAATATNSAAG